MFTNTAQVIHASALTEADLDLDDLDPTKIVSGAPKIRSLSLHDSADLAVGVWQHSAGVSRDIEADEIFVVLSGRATIEITDGPTLEVGPGDVGLLPAGAQTVWTIHESLRKIYVVRP